MATKRDLVETLLVAADAAEDLGQINFAKNLRELAQDPLQHIGGMGRVPVYRVIAETVMALENSRTQGNEERIERHQARLEELVNNNMPNGSGFDSGTTLDVQGSTPDHLIFSAPFHEMDEGGYYVGWRDVEVHVRPSLVFGFVVTVRHAGKRDLADYIAEVFQDALGIENDT